MGKNEPNRETLDKQARHERLCEHVYCAYSLQAMCPETDKMEDKARMAMMLVPLPMALCNGLDAENSAPVHLCQIQSWRQSFG